MKGRNSLCMSWHIHFRDNLHMTLCGILYKFAQLLLCVVASVESLAFMMNDETRVEFKFWLVLVILHTDGILLVEFAPRSLLCQFRIAFYLYSPSLVVGKVKMQAVHLVMSQDVHLFLQIFECIEMSGTIEHQSSPLKTRIVSNGHLRQCLSVLCTKL